MRTAPTNPGVAISRVAVLGTVGLGGVVAPEPTEYLLNRDEVRDLLYGRGSGISSRVIYKLSHQGAGLGRGSLGKRGTIAAGTTIRLASVETPAGMRWRRADVLAFRDQLAELRMLARGLSEHRTGRTSVRGEADRGEHRRTKTVRRGPLKPRSASARTLDFCCSDALIGTYPIGPGDEQHEPRNSERMERAPECVTDGEGLPGERFAGDS